MIIYQTPFDTFWSHKQLVHVGNYHKNVITITAMKKAASVLIKNKLYTDETKKNDFTVHFEMYKSLSLNEVELHDVRTWGERSTKRKK